MCFDGSGNGILPKNDHHYVPRILVLAGSPSQQVESSAFAASSGALIVTKHIWKNSRQHADQKRGADPKGE